MFRSVERKSMMHKLRSGDNWKKGKSWQETNNSRERKKGAKRGRAERIMVLEVQAKLGRHHKARYMCFFCHFTPCDTKWATWKERQTYAVDIYGKKCEHAETIFVQGRNGKDQYEVHHAMSGRQSSSWEGKGSLSWLKEWKSIGISAMAISVLHNRNNCRANYAGRNPNYPNKWKVHGHDREEDRVWRRLMKHEEKSEVEELHEKNQDSVDQEKRLPINSIMTQEGTRRWRRGSLQDDGQE